MSDVQTIRLESVKRSPKIIARIVLCLFLSRMLEVGILIFFFYVLLTVKQINEMLK